MCQVQHAIVQSFLQRTACTVNCLVMFQDFNTVINKNSHILFWSDSSQ